MGSYRVRHYWSDIAAAAAIAWISYPINAKGDYPDQKSHRSRRANGENAPAIYSWWVSQGCTWGLYSRGPSFHHVDDECWLAHQKLSLGAWTLWYHTSAGWVAKKSPQNLRASLWSQVSWDAVGDSQWSISLVVKEICSLFSYHNPTAKRGLLLRFWVGDAICLTWAF